MTRKSAFNIGSVLAKVRRAVKPYPKAAMFDWAM